MYKIKMRPSSRINLLRYFLLCYFILVDIEKHFKSSNHEGRDAYKKQVNGDHERKLNNPPQIFILPLIKNRISLPFYCKIKEVANYKRVGEYFKKDISINWIVKLRWIR